MTYNLDDKLVIGLASSALFDLVESDRVFREEGEEAYRTYQREHQNDTLKPGVAFPFIKRILSINELNPENPPIEVILLSKNNPDTGLRVMHSIADHKLNITRAAFLEGRVPHKFIPALSISLFLSANEKDVRNATAAGFPAGHVLDSTHTDDADDQELRIAFDFDGVIADDEAETVYQKTGNLGDFHEHETKKADITHNPGPLKEFLSKLTKIQALETKKAKEDLTYKPKIRISIVTARNAPSHLRVINTMRSWGITTVNEAFFLGGIEKKKVLEIINPHIFFDDQKTHLVPASSILPSVHIPFGIRNS